MNDFVDPKNEAIGPHSMHICFVKGSISAAFSTPIYVPPREERRESSRTAAGNRTYVKRKHSIHPVCIYVLLATTAKD